MGELLNPAQLVEQTREDFRRAFGNMDIPVATPSNLVLETQRVAIGKGFGFFTPRYFPSGETRLGFSTPPGWKKLNSWFFEQMMGGKPNVSPDAAKIGAYWVLFDESERPKFAGDEQFGLILARGRDEGKIEVPDHVAHLARTSRFGVSMNEQDRYVFPKLAKPLRLVDRIAEGLVVIRRPKVAEFNFAGNLWDKHLGEDQTWEGFEDKFGGDRRLFGGLSGIGGLSLVDYGWFDRRDGLIAFRPVVVFLSQPQSLVTW